VSAEKTKSRAPKKKAPARSARAVRAAAVAQAAARAAAAATAAESAPSAAATQPLRVKGVRTLTGRVVSNRMQKTVAVEIERLIRHPTYGKYIRRTTKLLAHDENGASQEGDLVTIIPCRPMSRRKSWRLLAVVEKAVVR
jgi:small subunit ribosomal protein S17